MNSGTSNYNILIKERDGLKVQLASLIDEKLKNQTELNNIRNQLGTISIYVEQMEKLKKEKAELLLRCESAGEWKAKYDIMCAQYNNVKSDLENSEKHKNHMVSAVSSNMMSQVSNIELVAKEWKDKYEALNIKNHDNENKLATLQLQLTNYQNQVNNLNNEKLVLISAGDKQSGEWKTKYEALAVKFRDYEGLLLKYQDYDKKFATLQLQLTNSQNQINTLNNEKLVLMSASDKQSGEWKTKYERLLLDMNELNQKVKNNDNIVAQLKLQNEQHVLHNVQMKSDLEKVRNNDGLVSQLKLQFDNQVALNVQMKAELEKAKTTDSQISLLVGNLNNSEVKMKELNTLNATLKLQLESEKKQRADELNLLKLTINNCREEFNRLSVSYESLLKDIKEQIDINEKLRGLVGELMLKIESHNLNVGSLDSQIKQQIEVLTRHSLSKKYIDALPNTDILRNSEKNLQILKGKVVKLETDKLHKSQVFSSSSISGILDIGGAKPTSSGQQDVSLNYNDLNKIVINQNLNSNNQFGVNTNSNARASNFMMEDINNLKNIQEKIDSLQKNIQKQSSNGVNISNSGQIGVQQKTLNMVQDDDIHKKLMLAQSQIDGMISSIQKEPILPNIQNAGSLHLQKNQH